MNADDRLGQRTIPQARSGDHDADRRVPWPDGIFDLRTMQELEVGMLIAPAAWETAFLAGEPGMPWARVEREPFSLKVLGPAEQQWRVETKVACRLDSGENLYYVAAPAQFVRVLLPTPAPRP